MPSWQIIFLISSSLLVSASLSPNLHEAYSQQQIFVEHLWCAKHCFFFTTSLLQSHLITHSISLTLLQPLPERARMTSFVHISPDPFQALIHSQIFSVVPFGPQLCGNHYCKHKRWSLALMIHKGWHSHPS